MLDPLFIPLSDGTRLAARIWLPTIDSPVPAILEPLPYRRNDGTFIIDQPRYTWWAEHGFAGVRVDIRGSGDSDGLITDEYLRQEQDDTIEVLAWLADQPWCTGRVAMMGFSWGGFAGLQVAARRPPQLTCVVTVNSVVRRYTDDCHYTGGCVNAYDLLSWADTMYAWNARPPDPAIVGDRWREMWMARLNAGPPMIETWLSHQLEDDYWRHGSVCFDYDAITVPVLAVGGWADPSATPCSTSSTTSQGSHPGSSDRGPTGIRTPPVPARRSTFWVHVQRSSTSISLAERPPSRSRACGPTSRNSIRPNPRPRLEEPGVGCRPAVRTVTTGSRSLEVSSRRTNFSERRPERGARTARPTRRANSARTMPWPGASSPTR